MIGRRLDAYEIVEELGSGGMGTVYLARVTSPTPGLDEDTTVALKVIHPHLLDTPGFFKRFLREAQIGQDVQHENVVRCYDCDATLIDEASQHFLVMEYVEGQTLRDLLEELERVPEELCRHIGREVAKGLAAIHEAGVVHRDIKPENVLITPDHIVKVMDLGVARLQVEAVRLSQTGAFVGSLPYAAPEQFDSAGGEADGRADLHALGVLLYELSTGEHPFDEWDAARVLRNILDKSPRRAGVVNPQLSPFFEEVVHTLLAKSPSERFQAASDLAAVLQDSEDSTWWRERAKALRVRTKRPLRRVRIPRETALYGRDDDLVRLHALFEEVKAGDGRVLLLEGEAGVGKTRLVDDFVGQLQQEGEDLNFLFGSYPPGGAATAAGAFSTAYREHFGEQGLEDVLSTYLHVTPLLVPAFAALLRGDATPAGAESLTKDSLQTVFAHATRGLATERPTIVLVDDLHFAPEEGKSLFASLALACPGHRILLVGTSRPGLDKAWIANLTRLEQTEHRYLPRLGPKHLSLLLKDAFRSERLARDLALHVGERSDGNPFFVFEIIRGLREGEFISMRPDGTWVTTKAIQDIQVPSTVADLVQARIAGLSEEERELLDVAACCGFEFDPLLVARVLGLSEVPALRQLGHLERPHRLVRSVGRSFCFDHHQIQEALYHSLSELLRERYHAAIADALEGMHDVDPRDTDALDGDVCVALTDHLLRAGRGERSLLYLPIALRTLEGAVRHHQAVMLADGALSREGLLQGEARLDVLLAKANRLGMLARLEEEAECLREASRVADTLPKSAMLRVMPRMVTLSQAQGLYAEAVDRGAEYLAAARESGDRREKALAAVQLGTALAFVGELEEAEKYLRDVLLESQELGDVKLEWKARSGLAQLGGRRGRHDEARLEAEHLLDIAATRGEPQSQIEALTVLGHQQLELGRLDEARRSYESAAALAREIGHRPSETVSVINLTRVAFEQGDLDGARQGCERALDIAQQTGDLRAAGIATSNLAAILASLGRSTEARPLLQKRMAEAHDAGDREGEFSASLNLAVLEARVGRLPQARDRTERCLAIAHELGSETKLGRVLLELAGFHEIEGDLSVAEAKYHEAQVALHRTGARAEEAEAWLGVGATRLEAGRLAEAEPCLRSALGIALANVLPGVEVMARVHLARLPGGDVQAARAALDEHADDLPPATCMAAHLGLWQSGRDTSDLRAAKAQLDHFVHSLPGVDREARLEGSLERRILRAWVDHGGAE